MTHLTPKQIKANTT